MASLCLKKNVRPPRTACSLCLSCRFHLELSKSPVSSPPPPAQIVITAVADRRGWPACSPTVSKDLYLPSPLHQPNELRLLFLVALAAILRRGGRAGGRSLTFTLPWPWGKQRRSPDQPSCSLSSSLAPSLSFSSPFLPLPPPPPLPPAVDEHDCGEGRVRGEGGRGAKNEHPFFCHLIQARLASPRPPPLPPLPDVVGEAVPGGGGVGSVGGLRVQGAL